MSRPQFDPSAYAAQLEDKKSRLAGLLAPFAAPAPEVFESPREHYRLRAEFRLWRETGNEKRHYAMFEQGDKHTPILLEDFPIASRRINELMPRLKAAWADPALGFKLFQVEFLTTLAGDALITLCYHRPIDDAWRQAAEKLAAELGVNLVGRSRGKRIVVGRDYVEEELSVAGRRFRYRQPEGAFTQPNGEVNQKMLGWAYEALGQRDDDLLELYCGNGNFTLPLATRVRKVLATEISKSSVNAALANLADNAVDNVSLVRLSAEELTQADVLRAEVLYDQNGRPGVEVTFTEPAARRLAALTGEARGRTLAVLVDGRLRLAPRVREPIRNGKVYLDGLASVYEARELADQLNALGSQPGR